MSIEEFENMIRRDALPVLSRLKFTNKRENKTVDAVVLGMYTSQRYAEALVQVTNKIDSTYMGSETLFSAGMSDFEHRWGMNKWIGKDAAKQLADESGQLADNREQIHNMCWTGRLRDHGYSEVEIISNPNKPDWSVL